MSGPGPLPDSALDRLLDQLPSPSVPPGLAQRIVARTSARPQHERRETVISLAPPAARPLRRQAFGQRIAGLSALAAAACLLAMLWPLGMRPTGVPIARQATATAGPVETTPQQPVRLATAPRLRAKRGLVADAPPTSARLADAARPSVEPAAALPEQGQDIMAEAPPPEVSPQLADAVPSSDVAGPKAPVQGPPTPIDLMPASRPTVGLGVAGGTGGGGIPRQR